MGKGQTGLAAIVTLVGITLGVAAAVDGASAQQQPASLATAQPASQQAVPRTLDELIAVMEREAKKAGVEPVSVRRALTGLERDPEVVGFAAAQTEHERTVGQYVGLLVSTERIELGRTKLAENAKLLADIEARYGVSRHTLTALWGVETRYGAALGVRPVIRALATLAMEESRRPEFWRGELLQAIRIVERGDITVEALVGSWAGAIGHTQFMPSTFNRFAVDFDGDGRRDVMGSTADALASAAAYLAQSGWQRGETWGFEVTLPEDFDFGLSAPQTVKPLSFWAERGVKRADGSAMVLSALEHRVLLPAGASGPVFLVNKNFGALLRYNPAVSYALAVAHLGDRIAGLQSFARVWPNEAALPRAARQELQERLAAKGYDTGGVDGIIGSLTRNAIRSYQKANGLLEDGYPSPALLDRLRLPK